jgi:competence protein ComEC
LIAFYLAVLLVILLCDRRRQLAVAVVALVWYSAAFVYELGSSNPTTMTVTFVDVGHGTSVLLQPPHGLPWLYDAGRMGPLHRSARPIEAVLWHARIRRLGGVFMSHADADHYCAMPSLIKKFAIDCVVVPPGIFDGAPPLLNQIEDKIRSKGIPLLELTAGDQHSRR